MSGGGHLHLTDEASALIAEMYRDGTAIGGIAEALGVSLNTVYHHIDRHALPRRRNVRISDRPASAHRLRDLMTLLSRPGVLPSFREMKTELRLSTHTLQACLRELERLGYVRLHPGQPRRIDVLVRFVPAADATIRRRGE